jgi:hypothetical protein
MKLQELARGVPLPAKLPSIESKFFLAGETYWQYVELDKGNFGQKRAIFRLADMS